MRVASDREMCCSNGMCAFEAPDVFDLRDDDGTVVVLQEHPPEELHDGVHRAVDSCPTGAIWTEPS